MSRTVRAGELVDTARFEALSREGCIDEWRRTIGGHSLKYVSVQFMRSALAYEAQIKAHGGHSRAVRKVLKAALKTDQKASDAGGRSKSSLQTALRPGTHLVREWNGRTYQVEVLEDGFQMDGKQYRSLSAIAKKITDAHWSGPRFFGLG
ncbi:DUF2924 domain-containing protein [Pseudohoeflea coraliihabitans]|uniref:DUF2924 domain-containing protein n=1 Tax=Pseudohoeflea coraliihabitans TaxID=2860393 RepID=A0ABS6WN09_9HYPH|nr:DUF2924 domain-containing protein [Pseudohoeflea sp. DP4N28-3]MBW3097175.1 DUF2924 domain-containing protein [Pseudohoeflea sp. DP4N28-3]